MMLKETMKKLTGKMLILLLACLVLLQTAGLAEDGFSTSYTYTYDYWEDVQESPDAYRVATVIDSMSLGLENLENIRINKAQSLFVRNQFIYVCDTNNNRILEIERKGNSFSLSRVIREIQGAEINTFSTPYDVFVDEDYNLYVADYGNQRVVMMDRDLNWIRNYTKPSDATFDQSLNFLPKKIVADVAGRVYALCQNVNKGLVKVDGFAQSHKGYGRMYCPTLSAEEYYLDMIDGNELLDPAKLLALPGDAVYYGLVIELLVIILHPESRKSQPSVP